MHFQKTFNPEDGHKSKIVRGSFFDDHCSIRSGLLSPSDCPIGGAGKRAKRERKYLSF